MYNLLSILLGLTAWCFGIRAIVKQKSTGSTLSFACCGVSLYCQLLEIQRREALRDWAAIEDTIEGMVFAGTVLLAVTAALNLLAFLRGK